LRSAQPKYYRSAGIPEVGGSVPPFDQPRAWPVTTGREILSLLDPAQAEGMAGRIGVHLEVVVVVGLGSLLEETRPQRHHLLVRRVDVLHPEIEMDLLRVTVGPFRRHMIGSQLDSYPRLSVDVDHAESVVDVQGPVEYSSPEIALGLDVGGVEDDDLVVDLQEASSSESRRRY